MPANEEKYQQQFDQDRARQAERSDQDRARQTEAAQQPVAPGPSASFPWGMLVLAALFDLIGLIPVINLATETLAGLIIGWWQKNYVPKLDPVLTFIIAKIIDALSLGILPSNIGIVIYAYIKKKAGDLAQTPLGQYATNKILKNQET